MSQYIEIIISPQGQSQLQTHGFAGNTCRQASAFLEQALGTSSEEQLTPEFYLNQSNETQQQHRE